jgi:hypothetical protein
MQTIDRRGNFQDSLAWPGRKHLRCRIPFYGDECRESFAWCGVRLSGCPAEMEDSKEKNTTNDRFRCFPIFPIDHIDERLVYLWGAGFGRGVVMMA